MPLHEILRRYFPIADYIAAVNGKRCEVLIHDVSNINHSICYIVNGHITGRTVGGSITNYAFELLQNEVYKHRDSVTNYPGRTPDGKKMLRSSTFFIRDDEGEVIGLLCVNIDITNLLRVRDFVDESLMTDAQQNEAPERFDTVVDDVVHDIINSVVLESGLQLVESDTDQKSVLINTLEAKGVFKFKGAVATVANVLGVSPQTVYRHLNKQSKGKNGH